jgi:hypothetical protein
MSLSPQSSQGSERHHKYGIEMPAPARSTEEAVQNDQELDQRNGNTFWMEALSKEMGALVVAFEMLEHGQKAPAGWFKSTGHIIWDVKMDFTRKA